MQNSRRLGHLPATRLGHLKLFSKLNLDLTIQISNSFYTHRACLYYIALKSEASSKMLCAVYTSKFLFPLSDYEVIQVFKKYQALNLQLKITGCLVHHKNELLHFVEGDKKSINDFYLKKGMADFVKHADPIYLEEKTKVIFEYPYVISEALWQHAAGSSIPILNHLYLAAIREQLGNRTLALNFFWKCLDEMMYPSKCGM